MMQINITDEQKPIIEQVLREAIREREAVKPNVSKRVQTYLNSVNKLIREVLLQLDPKG